MKWCPITLRVDTDDPKTASGLYVFDEKDASEFVVTLSAPLAAQLRLTRGKALGALEVSLKTVQWEDLELQHEAELASANAMLEALGNDFTFLPDSRLTALVFRFADGGEESKRRSHYARSVLSIDSRINKSKVVIQSSPLAGFNAPLFHGFTSTGTVSLVRENLVCVDARYLDGMEGACVSGTGINDGSIGMVAGSLVKANGQGRLLVVVPWASIAKHLPDLKALHTSAAAPLPIEHKWSGIVVVQLKLKGNRVSWGSGVLIGPDLVVTNNHVVSASYTDLQVWLERRYPYSVAAVSQPLEGLDLVFLKLGRHVPGKYKPVPLAEADPPASTPVVSHGYGLFLPHRNGGALQPLASEGIVNKKVDGMLISSAACWNGSSGGALLNKKGELVGVMASNARDNLNGEIIPDLSFVIPVSVVKSAISQLNATSSTFPAATSAEFQKLWKLQKTHRDVRRKMQARI